MSGSFLQTASGRDLFKAAAAAIFILALTSVHHAYGAIMYDTPWRLHIVQLSIPAALVIAGGFYSAWRNPATLAGRLGGWTALAVATVFAIAMIGFYEGGYNHVLKNVLYFAGPEGAAKRLFSSPVYEMPNDFVFEATGIAQLPAALIAARYVWRLCRGGAQTAGRQDRRLIDGPLHSVK